MILLLSFASEEERDAFSYLYSHYKEIMLQKANAILHDPDVYKRQILSFLLFMRTRNLSLPCKSQRKNAGYAQCCNSCRKYISGNGRDGIRRCIRFGGGCFRIAHQCQMRKADPARITFQTVSYTHLDVYKRQSSSFRLERH